MENAFIQALNMSINASIVVLAVLVLRFLLKKSPKWVNCALWCFVAARLVFPFSLESIFSLMPGTEPLPTEIFHKSTPTINTNIQNTNQIIDSVAENITPAAPNTPTFLLTTLFVFAVIWLIGISAMLIYALISFIKIKHKISTAIFRRDNIWICDDIESPFILGLFKPQIYLPSTLDSNDRKYVIAHENAHIKRRDYFWKPFGFLLLSVYWFNPLIWLAYIILCRDIELACDEKVLKDMGEEVKKPYSTALVNCSAQRKMIAACPVAFGETGLTQRIKNILSYKKPTIYMIIVAVVALTVTAVCLLTNPITKAEDQKTQAETTTAQQTAVTTQAQQTTQKTPETTTSPVPSTTQNNNDENKIDENEDIDYDAEYNKKIAGYPYPSPVDINNREYELWRKLDADENAPSQTNGEYTYYVTKDNSCVIEKYTGLSRKVNVPAEIDGHPVKLLQQEAFARNILLTEITIPEGVVIIDTWVFRFCTNLKKVNLPDSLQIIEDGAFLGCSSLEYIKIPPNVRVINGFSMCTNLKKVDFAPENIQAIGYMAFSGCSRLEEFTVPPNVTYIDMYAFENCKSLKKVTFNSKLYEIEEDAFSGCTALESIVLPSSLKYVNNFAFYGCNLKSVTFEGDLTSLSATAFNKNALSGSRSSTKFYVPKNSYIEAALKENGVATENIIAR